MDKQSGGVTLPLGLEAKDLVKFGGLIVLLIGFYIRTNDFMMEQKALNKTFSQYMQNHDGWTSAITGLQFELGRPTSVQTQPNFGRNRFVQGVSEQNHGA